MFTSLDGLGVPEYAEFAQCVRVCVCVCMCVGGCVCECLLCVVECVGMNLCMHSCVFMCSSYQCTLCLCLGVALSKINCGKDNKNKMTNGTHFSFFLPQGEAFRTVLGHEKTHVNTRTNT